MKSLFALAAACIAATTVSAQSLYTVRENDDVLQRIDISNPNAPTISDVGALNTSFAFGGLTFGPGGQLFMVGGRGNNNLFTVNTSTGNATLVGSHGINDLFAVAWDSRNGVMYATQFSQGSGLYQLNPNDGSATTINGQMRNGIGGLTYNPQTDMLVGSNDGAGDLYDIDRSNGNQSLLFDGPFVNDSGLAYDSLNNYYWGIDWSGNLFYYDIDNGYARNDVLTGLGAHDGLAYFVIPSPGAVALFAISGLVGARRRRRA